MSYTILKEKLNRDLSKLIVSFLYDDEPPSKVFRYELIWYIEYVVPKLRRWLNELRSSGSQSDLSMRRYLRYGPFIMCYLLNTGYFNKP